MVERDAFDAAELSHYVEDVALLAGREHALTVMDAIVGTLAATQIVMHSLARCSPQILRHIVVEMFEAPCFLYQFGFGEARAFAALPS